MNYSVLVVGHADADGHLIAEQVRRNLSLIDTFDVKVVVDPQRTKDHKAWTNLDSIIEINDADIVFFVDLMFAPASFEDEADALVDFVGQRREKQFFLIDHHPLPLKRLSAAENLRVMYRPEVFECAIGPRSGMMVLAALCEGQDSEVADIVQPVHSSLARGVRRAAAPGGQLPGDRLLALLRSDCWTELAELGEEDKALHYLPRGRRPLHQPESKMLESLRKAASRLLSKGGGRPQAEAKGSASMAYDFDVAGDRYVLESGHRHRVRNMPDQSRDLETIITLLEVAALSLTSVPGATFTHERLIAEAKRIGGPEVDLREDDIKIVLQKQSFLKKVGKELQLR
jgi:hypothetical protein